jgi:hypothetical protein
MLPYSKLKLVAAVFEEVLQLLTDQEIGNLMVRATKRGGKLEGEVTRTLQQVLDTRGIAKNLNP